MIQIIENEYLYAEINETGAELYSLKSKKTQIEYLWQGNKNFWDGRSPVLFPICGRLYQGKYLYRDKEYEMPIHGFAKTSLFKSHYLSKEEIEFTLLSSEDTKKQYPFDFEFVVKYSLKNNMLEVSYLIKNMDKKEMFFSFGAHPAFNVPFNKGEGFEDYYIEFNYDVLEKLVFSDKCFNTGEKENFFLKDKKLYLKHDLFDNDALFFETEIDRVRLRTEKRDNFIEIAYKDMTCLGIWHVPKTCAPYVCIEPWHGIPSDEGEIDDLMTKRQMIKLKPKKIFNNSYMIKVSEK